MNALALKHISLEGPAMLGEFLKSRVWQIREVNLDKGELPDNGSYDLVIVLGGPMGVYEEQKYPFLKFETDYIKDLIKKDVPIVGICLGAQLIAKALGARVARNKSVEIGWYKIFLTEEGLIDKIFHDIPEKFDVFHWHGDTFELPESAALLASSELCKNQVVRFKNNVYGFQCHFELDDASIRNWMVGYEDEINALKTIIDPAKILSDTNTKFNKYKLISIKIFENLLKAIYGKIL